MCVPCVQVAEALNFDNTGNVMIRIRRLFTWLVPQERALFGDRALTRDRTLIRDRALSRDRALI